MAFNWDNLLNPERRRTTTKVAEDKRSEFERDYDRLVSSSSLRRLQDKTQVFPLERHDFVRTRLTHSLEVSTLGRSFAIDVVRTLSEKGIQDLRDKETQIAAILSTICLAHDIGNPPFGHFGESAIRSWFHKRRTEFTLTVPQLNDFLLFEGNAQGFRILTYLQCLNDEYGLNLTYGTLASYHKYTASSTEVDSNKGRSRHKVGYYTSESKVFSAIQDRTGLNGARHPLAFLMEAADDIMYSTVDLEDALKKRVIHFDIILEALDVALKGTSHVYIVEAIRRVWRERRSEGWSHREADQIACHNLKILAVGRMFRACVDAFVNNYTSIMEGKFDDALIDKSTASDLHAVLKKVAQDQVYSSQAVALQEVIGAKVIHTLLDRFVPALMSSKRTNPGTLEGKLFNLISVSLRELNRIHGKGLSDNYDQLQLVTDFVCGMTDAYAHSLYRRLEGHDL